MREFNALPVGGKDDGVVANDIATAQRVHSDLTTRTLTH